MHERAQHARGGEPLQQRARLAQPAADALDLADGEPAPDERVQVDAARHDVAAGVGGREQPLEPLRLDEREVVPRRAVERALADGVAIAAQAGARDRLGALDHLHRRLGGRRHGDQRDDALLAHRRRRLERPPQPGVERRDEVAALHRVQRRVPAGRPHHDPRRAAERDDRPAGQLRDPRSAPVERGRLGDRHEAEAALGEPRPPRRRVARQLARRHAEDVGEAGREVVAHGSHRPLISGQVGAGPGSGSPAGARSASSSSAR